MYCTKAQALAIERGKQDALSALKLLEADCVDRQGNILLARRMYEDLKNELPKDQLSLQAQCRSYFAALLFDQGDFAGACREYQFAGELRAQDGNDYEPSKTLVRAAAKLEVINAHHALKLALLAKNKLSSVKESERANLIFRSLYGEVCYGIGRIYIDHLRLTQSALESFFKAETYLNNIIEYQEIYTNLLYSITHVYKKLGNDECHAQYSRRMKEHLESHPDLRTTKLIQAIKGLPLNIDSDDEIASDVEFIKLLNSDNKNYQQLLELIDERLMKMADNQGPRERMKKSTLLAQTAKILWNTKQFDLAIEYQTKACAEYPANINQRTQLGAYLNNQKRYQEALAIGRDLAQDYPDDHRGYMLSAGALFNTDQFFEAEPYALKVLDLEPQRMDIEKLLNDIQEKKRKNPFQAVNISAMSLDSRMLDLCPPVGNAQFFAYLKSFAERVSDNTDAFWYSRSKRKGNQNPESIAKAILIQDLKSRGREFYTYAETQLSGGRVDIILNLLGREYIIELKMCGMGYARSYAEKGFRQLKKYMRQRRAEYGFLVIFDGRSNQTGDDAVPELVDLGDGMNAYAVSINILGVEAT